MQAFLLAAGLGTRLKPLTDTKPKALVRVADCPLLQHVGQKLQRSGAHPIVVNAHHFAAQIIEYVETQNWSQHLVVSDESNQLLDTGGGLRKAQHLFRPDMPILIHNVDILSNADLEQLMNSHEGHDVTLLVSERETQRYLLFDATMRLVGWTNIKTGEVRSPYPDLDVSKCVKRAFSGIHVFSPHLFPLMESYPEKFPIMDFYLNHCHEIQIYGVTQPGLKLLDVGKCDTLVAAEAFIQEIHK